MSYPKLSVKQGTAIVNEVLYILKDKDTFAITFTGFLPPTARGRDAIKAARKWLERLQKGGAISPERMEALIKTLNVPLRRFENELLEEPGYCLSHYGVSFVKTLNDYFSKKKTVAVPAKLYTSKATRSGENDPDAPDFLEFFGPAMSSPDKFVQLVFPMRTLTKNPETSEERAFDLDKEYGDFTLKSKDGKSHSNVFPERVSGYLAFEDVRAATHVANFVSGTTRKNVWVRHSNAAAFDIMDETCIFAFGLAFTAATRNAVKRFNGKLFSIYCDKSRKGNFWTDYFDLKYTPSRKEKVGKSFLRDIPLRDGRDVALIVRVVPKARPGNKPTGQPWFVAAGRSAPGTTAAAYFLVNRWQDLASLYREHNKDFETDSLAVVVEHPEAGSSDYSHKSPLLIEGETEFHYWDGGEETEGTEKCIAWG